MSAAPSETIQVAVRMRPLMGAELTSGDACVKIVDQKSLRLIGGAMGDERGFAFDMCQDAGKAGSQGEFFDRLGAPMVDHSLKGYNVSIFACELNGGSSLFGWEHTNAWRQWGQRIASPGRG
jgi:hypothetical protein